MYVYIFLGFVLAIVVFIVWRLLSVPLGMKRRDEKLLRALDPIAERITKKELVTPDEISTLALQPQYRPLLYRMLKQMDRLDLLPAAYLSTTAQGEGLLAYWMMHPNELQDAPAEIELLEEVERERDGERSKYLVFRYRMPAGHWAEKDGWLLGLAGPFRENDPAYPETAVAFSRCGDKDGEIEPSALIDWYVETMARKGG